MFAHSPIARHRLQSPPCPHQPTPSSSSRSSPAPAFKLGQFKLSSGGTSDYYIDCRTTTLHAEGGRLTGHAILELLEANQIEAEAVGGLTMGADPIVSNVATASAWRALSHPQTLRLLHGFLVRKAEKAHGTGRRIEGFCRAGARVVIVDDVCTTGASTIAAIQAAQEAGMIVAAVVCIVEREEANGRPAVEAAAHGAPFLRLFTANEVRAEHVKQLSAAEFLISPQSKRADPLGPALRSFEHALPLESFLRALLLNHAALSLARSRRSLSGLRRRLAALRLRLAAHVRE